MNRLLTIDDCSVLLATNPGAIRNWSFGDSSISLLATGKEENLWAFALHVDPIDSRGNTIRCRRFCEQGNEAKDLLELVQHAIADDITLQLLCVGNAIHTSSETYDLGNGANVTITEHQETYPMIWLNSQSQKWGKETEDAKK